MLYSDVFRSLYWMLLGCCIISQLFCCGSANKLTQSKTGTRRDREQHKGDKVQSKKGTRRDRDQHKSNKVQPFVSAFIL